jgi:hypothetical protein
MPLMTGALGSTFVAARKYWDSFAVGGALVGIPVVIGENVVGVDRPRSGRSKREGSPRPRSWNGASIPTCGILTAMAASFVQLNVEDTRNGVAEYVADKYGDKCIIELKWGQGAKDIGGEIQVTSLDYALFSSENGAMWSTRTPSFPKFRKPLKKAPSNPLPATAAWAAPT